MLGPKPPLWCLGRLSWRLVARPADIDLGPCTDHLTRICLLAELLPRQPPLTEEPSAKKLTTFVTQRTCRAIQHAAEPGCLRSSLQLQETPEFHILHCDLLRFCLCVLLQFIAKSYVYSASLTRIRTQHHQVPDRSLHEASRWLLVRSWRLSAAIPFRGQDLHPRLQPSRLTCPDGRSRRHCPRLRLYRPFQPCQRRHTRAPNHTQILAELWHLHPRLGIREQTPRMERRRPTPLPPPSSRRTQCGQAWTPCRVLKARMTFLESDTCGLRTHKSRLSRAGLLRSLEVVEY